MSDLKKRLHMPKEGKKWTDHKGDAYLPDRYLVQAANVALQLKRPLLLMGEPGSGKTRFAGAVANELDWNFQDWYVKSTQTAKNALYTYDLVGRLRDGQLLANNAIRDEEKRKEVMDKQPKDYVEMRDLGTALTADKPTVLLIDEIDKADRDFPNDLLLELDEKRFIIEETGEEMVSTQELLIIITSNNERELPEPFLRRCIFFHINFPDPAMLRRILQVHMPQHPSKVMNAILKRFSELRGEMVEARNQGEPVKPPSTSELIDWAKVLRNHEDDDILKALDGKIPYAEVLVKRWEDHRKFISNQF